MSDTPGNGEHSKGTPLPGPNTVPNYNPPRQRSAPPLVRGAGEVSESPQSSTPPHQRATSVPGYPSPMPYAAAYGAAPPPAGGTYGQAMFPPPLPPAMYSAHTYQGSSAYPPQAHLPYGAPPPPTGYPVAATPHVYHPGQMGGAAQIMFPGYVKPMPATPSYPAGYPQPVATPQPFNITQPQTAGAGRYLPSFQEADMRQRFIRRVMLVVFIQLMVTIGVGVAALSIDSFQDYLKENVWVFWASLVGALVLLLLGCCNFSLLRQHPMHILFLCSFTALCSVMVGYVIARYDSQAVLSTFVVASGLTLTLVIMASRSNFDITNWGAMLFAFLLVLMVTSIVGVFWLNSIFTIVISAIGAVLFSIYLVYDVQMLMGDKKRALAPEDFVLGAISVYLDIVNIFLHLLSLIGLGRNRNVGD